MTPEDQKHNMQYNNIKILRAATTDLSIDFCREVMIKMRDKGYEMVALSSPGDYLSKLKEEDGFRIIEVPMERHISIWKDLRSLLKLIRVFRKEKPQVVHSITPKAGLLCMMASWVARVPYRIHTFTGLVWPTATGITKRILMITDWITCACATHIIPEGEGVKTDLQNHITRKTMRVLGYGNILGVDLKRFDPERFASVEKVPDCFEFLFVGRIVGDKGINELVRAFNKLSKEFSDIRLKLVGDYEPELDSLQEDVDKEIKDNSRIEANGALYGDDLLRAYVAADCFVMPSYREGFPNSVLEAGAMGLPQVVTDINGSREIIKDGFNGLIVPSKDEDALYRALKLIYQNNSLRSKLSSNARQSIADRFERSFVQQCQIDYYDELLNNNI